MGRRHHDSGLEDRHDEWSRSAARRQAALQMFCLIDGERRPNAAAAGDPLSNPSTRQTRSAHRPSVKVDPALRGPLLDVLVRARGQHLDEERGRKVAQVGRLRPREQHEVRTGDVVVELLSLVQCIEVGAL